MSEAETAETKEGEKPEVKEVEKTKFSREDWEHSQRDKASKSGWKDFDDYVTEGGDPDKWKTADAFNLAGEFMSTLRRKDADFERRLEGVQKLSQAQLEVQRTELTAKRDEMIEQGKVKEVHVLDKQIDTLTQQQQMPSHHPHMDTLNEWNSNNAWINEKTPKASHARLYWSELSNSGTPIPQALSMLEAEIKKHFPPQSTQRTATLPETESSKGSRGFTQKTSALTMADLNDEERLAWRHMGHAWKSEKEFLQAASDMRKATKGGK